METVGQSENGPTGPDHIHVITTSGRKDKTREDKKDHPLRPSLLFDHQEASQGRADIKAPQSRCLLSSLPNESAGAPACRSERSGATYVRPRFAFQLRHRAKGVSFVPGTKTESLPPHPHTRIEPQAIGDWCRRVGPRLPRVRNVRLVFDPPFPANTEVPRPKVVAPMPRLHGALTSQRESCVIVDYSPAGD